MKLVTTAHAFTISAFALAIGACDSKESKESTPDATASAAADEAAADAADGETAEAEPAEDLRDKSCEDYYALAYDYCTERHAAGKSCYMTFTKVDSARKIMAGESMQKMTKGMTEEQKVKAFCSRYYEDLAEKAAEEDLEPVEHLPVCAEALALLDEMCLEPMKAGKEPSNHCRSTMQMVSRLDNEDMCTVQRDGLLAEN